MNIPPNISERRSVFPQFFTGQPIADDTLAALLEAANFAPSHRKTEPWRFQVYRGTGKDKLLDYLQASYEGKNGAGTWTEQLAKKFGKKLNQSAAVLTIFMARDPEASVPEWEEIAATSCAVQNMWTSLGNYGLGGYWSSPSFICGYKSFPVVPDDWRCLGMFYLGYHQAPELPRKLGHWKEKVTFVE